MAVVTMGDLRLYYEFIDKQIDLTFMRPIYDPTEYTEKIIGGPTSPRQFSKESLALWAIDRKCNLWYNLKRDNYDGALSDMSWFESVYGIHISDIKVILKNDILDGR